MDEAGRGIFIAVDLGFGIMVLGRDEGGFATVTGIGIEDNFELVLGIGIANGRPCIALDSQYLVIGLSGMNCILERRTVGRGPSCLVSSSNYYLRGSGIVAGGD